MITLSGRGLVSLIKMPDGQLGLRVDKVLQLKQHSINQNTVKPVEGLVTAFSPRLIHKSTKLSEEKMDSMVDVVLGFVQHLPWAPEKPNPFEIYQHEIVTPLEFAPALPRASPPHVMRYVLRCKAFKSSI
jgi:hypothetical protein